MMGYSASPYFVTKDMIIIEKSARGDILEPSKFSRWELVKLNLPEIYVYNPSRPWVYT